VVVRVVHVVVLVVHVVVVVGVVQVVVGVVHVVFGVVQVVVGVVQVVVFVVQVVVFVVQVVVVLRVVQVVVLVVLQVVVLVVQAVVLVVHAVECGFFLIHPAPVFGSLASDFFSHLSLFPFFFNLPFRFSHFMGLFSNTSGLSSPLAVRSSHSFSFSSQSNVHESGSSFAFGLALIHLLGGPVVKVLNAL